MPEPEEVNVKIGGKYISADLSKGYVQVATGTGTTLFVREAIAETFTKVANQEFVSEGGKFVRPAKFSQRAGYMLGLALRFVGTSGHIVQGTTINGQEVVETLQYVRPTAKYAPAFLGIVEGLKELANNNYVCSAVVIAYPPGKKPKVLYVKGIKAYFARYRTSSGVKQYPDVRLYFTQQLFGGFKKRTPYVFDFLLFYAPKQVPMVKRWKEELAEAEARARSTPPPTIAVTAKPKAPTRTVVKTEPQPTTAVAMPQVEVVPQQPTAQASQPATVSSGKYVKPAEGGEGSGGHYIKPAEDTEQELKELYQSLADIDSGNTEAIIKRLRESQKHINL